MIVGCGRSGTTLLRAMLDAHPDVVIPEESHFVATMVANRSRYERPHGFDVDAFLDDLFETPRWRGWVRRWALDRAAIAPQLAAPPRADTAEAIRRVYRAYAKRSGGTIFGDKTPEYVSHVPALARAFPEARFIHVIRDGRNVALSYREAAFGPRTVAEGAIHWRRRVSEGRTGGREVGPHRYREISYEHLVADPESVLRGVCDFIEIAYHPAMTRHHERAPELLAAGLNVSDHRHLLAPVGPDPRDWRTSMTRAEVAVFEALAGPLLVELGYERGSAPSVAGRAMAAAAMARWQGRRAAVRLGRVRRSVARREGGGVDTAAHPAPHAVDHAEAEEP